MKKIFVLIFIFAFFCSCDTCTDRGNPFEYLKEEEKPFLESIYLNTIFAKKSYARGEPLDITNLLVRGVFSDGSEKTIAITEENISGYDCMKVGTQELTVSVERDGKTASAAWTVKVTEAVIVELIIKSLPTKTEYTESEKRDYAGLEVVVKNSDGTESPVDKKELLFTEEDSAEGEKTVFVHYRGYSDSFEIKVL
ncbi:MAG: bacterial Ig-like domain-containing protein [Spirochaetota bacterium]|nr:bacterial Ig-like domain-containing protein [Spirochaetota bacterium]